MKRLRNPARTGFPTRIGILILVGALITAATALAATPPLGARMGYTNWNSQDQIHVGGHVKLGDILPNVAFTPGLELGFGSGMKVLTLNGDLYYRATEFAQKHWQPYVGGSVSLNHANFDHGSETDLGLSALIGTTRALNSGNELLVEIRLGLIDSPGLKLTAGITFF
ncbi:hypothetical protein DRQ50_07265 [bacterium]|nr:MAG: hypothetical protein DRQ50_07265 [bacterium]